MAYGSPEQQAAWAAQRAAQQQQDADPAYQAALQNRQYQLDNGPHSFGQVSQALSNRSARPQDVGANAGAPVQYRAPAFETMAPGGSMPGRGGITPTTPIPRGNGPRTNYWMNPDGSNGRPTGNMQPDFQPDLPGQSYQGRPAYDQNNNLWSGSGVATKPQPYQTADLQTMGSSTPDYGGYTTKPQAYTPGGFGHGQVSTGDWTSMLNPGNQIGNPQSMATALRGYGQANPTMPVQPQQPQQTYGGGPSQGFSLF